MNYVDLDFTAGILDFMGNTGLAAQTYDGHRGIDINVPSFRAMDNNVPVFAAADGIVTEVYAASFDRNLGGDIASCSKDTANHVTLVHDNGFTTIYAHLKKNSVVVSVGQKVSAGDILGVVGSSGCSTAPHLHLETIDCHGTLIEPMKEGMFADPPIYTPLAPTTIMDTYFHQPVFQTIDQLRDPAPEPNSVKMNQDFSIGFALSHVKSGDNVHISIYNPGGGLEGLAFDATASTPYALSYWWGNFNMNTAGIWRFVFQVNGIVQTERNISIVP
jgi:hypothetical protein